MPKRISSLVVVLVVALGGAEWAGLVDFVGAPAGTSGGEVPATPPAASEESEPAPSDPAAAFASPEACQRYLEANPRSAKRPPRIGTWNIRWFPHGTPGGHDEARRTDLDWLACAIAALEVDVLAVQEILQNPAGRGALLDLLERLGTLTGGKWVAHLDDCADGGQHVGMLYDSSRLTVEVPQALAALNPGRSACDRNLRPGYGAYLRFKEGPDLYLIAVHLDSGVKRRDFDNRQRSIQRLGDALQVLGRHRRDADAIVLGDFNVMGCKKCTPEVSHQAEVAALDRVIKGARLRRLEMPSKLGCTHYYNSKGGSLDLVLASVLMKELAVGTRVEPFGPCRDLSCGRMPRERLAAYQRLSDHCPLVVDLTAQDLD